MRGLECVYLYPESISRDESRVRVVWSGARIKGRARIARWDGHVTLRGGRIAEARGYAFDSAAEGICAQTETRVEWKSVTSGDEDGVILTVDAGDGAELSFHSDITSFSVPLGELAKGPFVKQAGGGVDLQVQVEYLPRGLGRADCSFAFSDEAAAPGCHPYYVRLTQADGARAWSSPFYIHVQPWRASS